MARPKKPHAKTRPRVVAFRLNDEEFARLRFEADANGLRPTEVARAKVIGRFTVPVSKATEGPAPEPPALFALRNEVARVGVNLNQIARRLNMTGAHEPDELAAACWAANEVLRRILDRHVF